MVDESEDEAEEKVGEELGVGVTSSVIVVPGAVTVVGACGWMCQTWYLRAWMDAGGLETCGVVLDNIWQGWYGQCRSGRAKKAH